MTRDWHDEIEIKHHSTIMVDVTMSGGETDDPIMLMMLSGQMFFSVHLAVTDIDNLTEMLSRAKEAGVKLIAKVKEEERKARKARRINHE